MARVLERLQPLAAREAPRAGLGGMSAAALARAAAGARGLGAEGARRLEEDLGLYASLCGALRWGTAPCARARVRACSWRMHAHD